MLDFFHWLQYSRPLIAMRSSSWIFPVIASVHLMGLALLGGAVLVVGALLLGWRVPRGIASAVVSSSVPPRHESPVGRAE